MHQLGVIISQCLGKELKNPASVKTGRSAVLTQKNVAQKYVSKTDTIAHMRCKKERKIKKRLEYTAMVSVQHDSEVFTVKSQSR